MFAQRRKMTAAFLPARRKNRGRGREHKFDTLRPTPLLRPSRKRNLLEGLFSRADPASMPGCRRRLQLAPVMQEGRADDFADSSFRMLRLNNLWRARGGRRTLQSE